MRCSQTTYVVSSHYTAIAPSCVKKDDHAPAINFLCLVQLPKHHSPSQMTNDMHTSSSPITTSKKHKVMGTRTPDWRNTLLRTTLILLRKVRPVTDRQLVEHWTTQRCRPIVPSWEGGDAGREGRRGYSVEFTVAALGVFG